MHNKVLKHLGLVSILIMLMQLIHLGMVVAGKSYSAGELALNDFLLVFVAYLSYIWCGLKEKVVDGNKLHTIIGGLLVAVGRGATCIGAFYYAVHQYIMTGIMAEVWFGIILISVVTFAYGFMAIDYNREYDRIINLEIYVFLVAIGIVSSFFGIGIGSVMGLAFATIIGAMCKNQSSIDYLLERTQKNTPMVMQLRKYNIKWVLAAMLFLILAYSLRGIVVAGLEVVWQGIAYILVSIIKFLFSVQDTDEIPLDLSAQDMGEGYGMEAAGEGSNLYETLACIAVIVICIIKRREIWAFIKRKAQAMIWHIKVAIEWIQKVLFHVEKRESITTPYYSERVEEIRDIESVRVRKQKGLSKRRLERKIKELSKIADRTIQYRKKYKLLIEVLIWKGVQIKQSHTPRQIHQEALENPINLDLEKETKGYEDVRYGEILVTQEAYECLDEHLKMLIDKKK